MYFYAYLLTLFTKHVTKHFFFVYPQEKVIVNLSFSNFITRLKIMVNLHQTKSYLTGLLYLALVFAVSLPLTACENEADSASKNSAGNGKDNPAIFKGIVSEVHGDVSTKVLDGDVRHIQVGQKLSANNVLVVEPASSVVVTISDASVFKVDGKSEIAFDAAMVDSLRQRITVSLHSGKLLFDVQKQAVKDEFEIQTENLTSIVRGTAGFMEYADGLEVSSLKEGRLEIVAKTDSRSIITGGQTLLANASGVKTLSLVSSGTLFLAKAIDSLSTEMAATLGVHASKINLDSLESKLVEFDDGYKKKYETFVKRTQVQFKPMGLNEYIGKPSVLLEALFVPGAFVTVMGIRDTIPESGLYKRTFEWEDSSAFGPKHFVANCSNDEVEYICHTWNTNFVSSKMAEVLTKADERKAVAAKDTTVAQPQKLKLAVVVEGSGRERIHVLPEERDIPGTLRFNITGLVGADLKQITNITVKRKGKVIKVFNDDEITTNSFKLPIRLKQNRIAHFEIVARLSNGKKIKAKKVYETYCYFDNYEDGKKSNRIYDMSAEEEYKNVVQKQLLKDE